MSEPTLSDAPDAGLHADQEEVTSEADASTLTPDDTGGEGRFGRLSPREAAQKRWAEQRARQALVEQDAAARAADDVKLVTTPVRVGEIIQRLERDARNGSATAAKELRAWLDLYPPTDESFDPESLDRATRQRLYAALLASISDAEQDLPA